jgi:hypothetical protein
VITAQHSLGCRRAKLGAGRGSGAGSNQRISVAAERRNSADDSGRSSVPIPAGRGRPSRRMAPRLVMSPSCAPRRCCSRMSRAGAAYRRKTSVEHRPQRHATQWSLAEALASLSGRAERGFSPRLGRGRLRTVERARTGDEC